ncbi:MAG: type I polyketide synthase, partial [Myxococcota bacterium]
MAVSGGVDRCMGAPTYVKFAKIGALSPDGSRPFDAEANGFVMGEGGAILILKRLNDAIRDGDNIYATIRGVGGSSDGRGKGITAPNPIGQKLSYRRAYQDAGFSPKTVSLFEAHGTSTPVGDPAEVNSLKAVFHEDDSEMVVDRISIGSLKSMIGHLKAGAGAASLVKTALALKHKVLPPTLNVETPNPKLEIENSPFKIQHDVEPWELPAGAPRRAGVSAFGFGGTNFHVAMEEWQEDGSTARIENSGEQRTFAAGSGGSAGAQASEQPREDGILTFTGATVDDVADTFADFAARFDDEGLAATLAHRLPLESADLTLPEGGARLAISYTSQEGLEKQVQRTTKAFDRGRGWRILANQGIFLADETMDGKIAMLFPGQGTQYTGMLAELKRRFPVVQQTFDEADDIMTPVLGRPLSDIIFPEESGMDEGEARELLKQTENTQPAVLTADIALLRLLEQFGVQPDMVAGHSLGEYGACVAAGVMSFPDALRTVAQRGTQMAQASPLNGDSGLMASIPADADEVQTVLDQIDGYVVCANKNCPRQTIIAGLTKPVEEAVKIFEDDGHMIHMLEVSHAFHSKVVAEASEPLRAHLDETEIHSPAIDILTNVTGDFYPKGSDAPDQIRDLLAEQVASPVEFISEVDNMYDAGARIFIECGPKRAQTSFVDSILSGKDVVSMYTNHPKDGDVGSINNALAQLWARGVWSDATRSKRPAAETADTTEAAESTQSPGAATTQSPALSRDDVLDTMLGVLCDKTGYDPDEIEFDFELEADLGIDTVKQAEIMADVREGFVLPKDEDFRLADYPTLDAMADYVLAKLDEAGTAPETSADTAATTEAAESTQSPVPNPQSPGAASSQSPDLDRGEVLDTMLGVL